MVKVHNWLDSKQVPVSIRKEDMFYALGCMNYLLMQIIKRVKTLLEKQGQFIDKDYSKMIDEFEKGTFGKQIELLIRYYPELEISEKKMKKIRDERNYFIHNYEFGCNGSDAKRMYDLLNLMTNILGSLNNANQRMDCCNKKKKNQARNQLENDVKVAISKCKKHGNDVYLSEIGLYLGQSSCKLDGKLQDILQGLGYKIRPVQGVKGAKWVKVK